MKNIIEKISKKLKLKNNKNIEITNYKETIKYIKELIELKTVEYNPHMHGYNYKLFVDNQLILLKDILKRLTKDINTD